MLPKRREHLLLPVTLLCLCALAVDRFVATPLIHGWQVRARRITELTKSVSNGEVLVDREADLSRRWKNMCAQSLPRELAVTENDVLQAVDRWARDSQVSLTAQQPRWIVDEEAGCRKLEVRLAATGELGEIARFLYALETDPRALKVEDVDMTARDDKGQTLTFGLRFTGLVLEGEAS